MERGWRDHAPDLVLACVVGALLTVSGLTTPEIAPQSFTPEPVGYAAVVAGTLGLAVSRRTPLVALPVTTVAMLAYLLRWGETTSAAFPVLIAAFFAARAGRRLPAIAAGVVFLSGSLAITLSSATSAPREVVDRTGLLLGWFVAATVAGMLSRQRRAYLEQVEQRAMEAERTREETALRRAGEERLRIARELHDSLTHSISVIKVQAGVAVHLARKRGEDAPEALVTIQEAAGEAMRELRATLEVLRVPGDETAGGGVDRLPDLVDRVRSTGLAADLEISGTRRPLPGEVDRAAYRIVQEALTNVTRHAGRATAAVSVRFDPGELVVQVDDDGRAHAGSVPVEGFGLSGMRERVTALGGRLRAGARTEGGFTVRAEIPLNAAQAGEGAA
ncbi:two-component sensor histidine kinase [Planotetraspora thailandica]|uniref:histidine kinase n=1 Tax=Planotetraspora thailandica TaxID=487172 RepID=A0A8J3V9E1_9ACTN|nr:sensor histidine kinase [Planotetraspora thailandica]GII56474.1 two-component sensor histidine kinase [Planotetraspora thailandica]